MKLLMRVIMSCVSVDVRVVESRVRFCFPLEDVGKLRRHLLRLAGFVVKVAVVVIMYVINRLRHRQHRRHRQQRLRPRLRSLCLVC
jgi:hypothetical protein